MTTDPHVLDCKDWKAFLDRDKGREGGVKKLVIGSIGSDEKVSDPDVVEIALPDNFGERFASLTHLHVWGLAGLKALPRLPTTLLCLDVRNCRNLERVAPLPAKLIELVLNDATHLESIPLEAPLRSLRDLSLARNCLLAADDIVRLLDQGDALVEVDLTQCQTLRELKAWPALLERIELRDCDALKTLPLSWPAQLRRVGLRNCRLLEQLPDFHAAIDFIDLRNTHSLRKLPVKLGRPRSLFLHGSGLDLPDVMIGEAEENVAADVLAFREGKRVAVHEVKVILLGDGRSGKSSFARRLVEGEFDRHELTTHGIRLWTIDEFDFQSVDSPSRKAKAKVHVWDFAGQDLYHSTHRLFFQSRAIFVICETAAGDGADPTTDGTDDNELPKGWDTHHSVSYWRDQIESLGAGRAGGAPPPVLYLRTKCDRDVEPGMAERVAAFRAARAEALEGMSSIEFSAKDPKRGEGLSDVVSWLRGAVAAVLGPTGRNEIRADALQVKRTLEKKVAENDQAHDEVEKGGKREGEKAIPPHPVLSRAEFDQLVTEHCGGTSYAKRPELLLRFFHRGGFVFADPALLPDQIVLDQRWAIDGIYTAFDRRQSWPQLRRRRGRCTLDDLVRWGWRPYPEAHRQLFLHFMLSCGMAFEFGGRGGEAREFVIPRALPTLDADLEREARDRRAGAVETSRRPLHHRFLGRDSVLELLIRLGKHWRRAGLLWLWGGQFESFRGYQWEVASESRERTFVELNWVPDAKESFGGTLMLVQYGPDASLFDAILQECRSIGGFDKSELPSERPADGRKRLEPGEFEGVTLPRGEADGAPAIFQEKPPTELADYLTVGISFAGDSTLAGRHVRDWQELPAGSIERWPLALAAALRKLRVEVLEYRGEQVRPDHERTLDRQAFIDAVVGCDFVYSFVSSAFLESPWCMYEFFLLWERFEGRQDPTRSWFGAFGDARFSQTIKSGSTSASAVASSAVVSFRQHWAAALKAFDAEVTARSRTAGDGDVSVVRGQKELENFGYERWMRCISDQGKFDAIVKALHSAGGWNIELIDRSPTDDAVSHRVDQLRSNAKQADFSIESARRAWEQHSRVRDPKLKKQLRVRAMRHYVRGVLAFDPDGQPDGIEATLAQEHREDVLDDIRGAVQRVAARCKQPITSWRELDAMLAKEVR